VLISAEDAILLDEIVLMVVDPAFQVARSLRDIAASLHFGGAWFSAGSPPRVSACPTSAAK
jgi:hypothetical protein